VSHTLMVNSNLALYIFAKQIFRPSSRGKFTTCSASGFPEVALEFLLEKLDECSELPAEDSYVAVAPEKARGSLLVPC